jgi:hypothetical protein
MMNSVFACPAGPHEFMLFQMRGFGSGEVGPSYSGLTEDDFKDVLSTVRDHYAKEFSARNLAVEFTMDWPNTWFNAQAGWKDPKTVRFLFSGELARGRYMTRDALMFVACHEMGHHFGGLPRKSSWAAAEGQADYFAAVKCMRDILKNDPENAKAEALSLPEKIITKCHEVYRDADDFQLCLRTAKAGEDMTKTFQFNRTKSEIPGSMFFQELPAVEKTNTDYPSYACRAETAYQGAICNKGPEYPTNYTSESEGFCHEKNGDRYGMRPRCWYQPKPVNPTPEVTIN